MSEWISVKDRLPEPNTNVLVFAGENTTYWMPLPEPPEKPYEEWDRIAKEREKE